MTLLYLVRHGETDWNLRKLVQGATDIPLNATGREQALATGRLLATRHWDAIVSSPLSRALETARIIAREVGLDEPIQEPAIVERRYGQAEGLDHDAIDALFPGQTPVPGRETREEVQARVLPALIRLAEEHNDESVLIVSHGGVIRSVLTAVEPDGWHGTIRNGSVHSFRHVHGSLELVAFDDPIESASLGCATDDIDDQNSLESRAV
jgi:probable phosphoglycerate mutase